MPIYTYECEQCGKRQDAFRKIDQRYDGPECHGMMKKVISSYRVIGDLEPYVDENMGESPVVVKSRKHREQLLKERGLYEKIGKNWV